MSCIFGGYKMYIMYIIYIYINVHNYIIYNYE